MVAAFATWGESESDEIYEEKKRPCLVANDKVSSPLKSKERLLLLQQNKINEYQSDQVNALENEIGHLKNEISSLKNEIEVTEITCIRNRDLAYGQNEKSDKLKAELKTLKNENSLLLEKVNM